MERPVSRLGRKAKGPRRVVLVHVVGSRSCGARARVAAGLLTCATRLSTRFMYMSLLCPRLNPLQLV